MKIVLTRPQDDSERTAGALRARGHQVLVAPLLRVEAVAADLHHDFGAVIITSANAAAAVVTHPARAKLIALPVFAVGRRSAQAARSAGFSAIHTAGGDADDLVRLIAEHRPDDKAPLLYLAGEDRAGDLIGDLAVHDVAAELAVVYRAAAVPYSPELIAALTEGAVDAVLHFSRRSADQYIDGGKKAGIAAQAMRVRHLCLSGPIAESLITAGARNVIVANRPDESSITALINQPDG